MNIQFKNRKLEKTCNTFTEAKQRWGTDTGKLVMRRLDELRAADNLSEIRNFPQAHCEELRGNRRGQLSVRLNGPFRLIFTPFHFPVPLREDKGLDWSRVTEIQLLEVIDYHGK